MVEEARSDARVGHAEPRRRSASTGLVPRDVALVDDDGAPAEVLADVHLVVGEERVAVLHRRLLASSVLASSRISDPPIVFESADARGLLQLETPPRRRMAIALEACSRDHLYFAPDAERRGRLGLVIARLAGAAAIGRRWRWNCNRRAARSTVIPCAASQSIAARGGAG